MTELRVQADPTPREAYDAAVAAGRVLQPRNWMWIDMGLHAVWIFWLGIGATVTSVMVTGGPVLGAQLAFLALLLLTVWLRNRARRTTIAGAHNTPFSDGLEHTFSSSGILSTNGRSRWQTDWRDVGAVRETRRTIVCVVLDVTITVPKRAVDDPRAFRAQLELWHAEAGR